MRRMNKVCVVKKVFQGGGINQLQHMLLILTESWAVAFTPWKSLEMMRSRTTVNMLLMPYTKVLA